MQVLQSYWDKYKRDDLFYALILSVKYPLYPDEARRVVYRRLHQNEILKDIDILIMKKLRRRGLSLRKVAKIFCASVTSVSINTQGFMNVTQDPLKISDADSIEENESVFA